MTIVDKKAGTREGGRLQSRERSSTRLRTIHCFGPSAKVGRNQQSHWPNLSSFMLLPHDCDTVLKPHVNNSEPQRVMTLTTATHTHAAWKRICYGPIVGKHSSRMTSPPVWTKSTCSVIPVAVRLSLLKVNRNSVVWLYTGLTSCNFDSVSYD